MVKQVLTEKIKPGGLRVRDEMDLVALFGKGFAQFGCHHTATAEGRVTNNSDFHI